MRKKEEGKDREKTKRKAKHRKEKKRSRFIDDEASLSGSDDGTPFSPFPYSFSFSCPFLSSFSCGIYFHFHSRLPHRLLIFLFFLLFRSLCLCLMTISHLLEEDDEEGEMTQRTRQFIMEAQEHEVGLSDLAMYQRSMSSQARVLTPTLPLLPPSPPPPLLFPPRLRRQDYLPYSP